MISEKYVLFTLRKFLPYKTLIENFSQNDLYFRKFTFKALRYECAADESDNLCGILTSLIIQGYIVIYMDYVSNEGSDLFFSITDSGIIKIFEIISEYKAHKDRLYEKMGGE